jgi:hypothetical protein
MGFALKANIYFILYKQKCDGYFINLIFLDLTICRTASQLVMSTIPKRKHKRSDIGAYYQNETKTFWCVPKIVKTKAELFHYSKKIETKPKHFDVFQDFLKQKRN